jgi:hypothetical protein
MIRSCDPVTDECIDVRREIFETGRASRLPEGPKLELNRHIPPSWANGLSLAADDNGAIVGHIMFSPVTLLPQRGKAVDKRTDIWAFGCVLCCMNC